MNGQGPASFGYRVRKISDGWRWTAYDCSGAVTAEGRAKSRAAAAAEVIRRLAAPPPSLDERTA